MGWKISDLVPFPLGTWKVVIKTPLKLNDSILLSHELIKLSKIWIKENNAQFSKIKNLFKNELSSSGPLPYISDPILEDKITKLKKEKFHLKIKGVFRKITLFRFFLAKLLFDKEEGLHFDEFVVMWEVFQTLLDQNDADPAFASKYGCFFREAIPLFLALRNQTEFPIRVDEKDPETFDKLVEKLQPFLPSRTAYFGLKSQKSLRSGFSLIFDSEIPLRSLVESRRIGVGYRDKGSRRNPALDGSPDWREVALSSTESQIMEVEQLLGIGRESENFDWDLVYPSRKFPEEINEEGTFPPQS